MKKIGLLTTLLVAGLLLTGCNKTTVENPEIIDDCVISGNCMSEEPIDYESESNILSVDENKILSTDELKKACEKDLWGVKSENIVTTWTDEKLFINTYSFKGITETDGINTVYCNVTLDGVVLDAAFYLDEGQTIEELHKQLDYTPGSSYPNLKEYYGFVGTIVLGNRLQTTYITGKNILYFDNSRGIALKLGDIPDGGLIREIDTDEGGIPRSEIIFLIRSGENEENRTGINGYREMFTIVAISKENLENFGASLHDLPFKYAPIGENNQYYFVETNIEGNYSDLQIFDVEVPDDFDGCNNYFDGCNRCTMQDDGEIICTEEACEVYQEAYCGDKQNNQFLEAIKSSGEQPQGKKYLNIPSFEELEDVVAMCPYEVMGGGYSEYPVYKREFIIPYKDGYIGYNYGGNGGGWGYYLTYKSLDKPCEIISYTDDFFYRHVHYKRDLEEYNEYEYPDNKVYLSQGGMSGIPMDIVEKELNCESGKDMNEDNICKKEVDQFMYNLILGKEENETFTEWMDILKKSIDNTDYYTGSIWFNRWENCNKEFSWESLMEEYGEDNRNLSEEKRREYRKIQINRIHECLESLNLGLIER